MWFLNLLELQAGDAAAFPNPVTFDGLMRVEHHVNAERTGQVAGENMAGGHKPYDYISNFWYFFVLSIVSTSMLNSFHSLYFASSIKQNHLKEFMIKLKSLFGKYSSLSTKN